MEGHCAAYWMNLQSRYDLDVVADGARRELSHIKPLDVAA